MNLRELASTCHRVCEIDAEVRDYSNGRGLLIKEYHIGPQATEDRFPDMYADKVVPRWTCIRKPINYIDTGKDYYGLITKDIPKELLDMEVHNWDLWTGWSTNNGLCKHMTLMVNLVGKDDCILSVGHEVQEQLDGQMQIEDFLGDEHD